MPEFPDIELYLTAMREHIVGQALKGVVVKSPFLLRTWEIEPQDVAGKLLLDVSRTGKRIVWHFEDGFFFVFHLMLTGRWHKRKAASNPKGKHDLAAFHFSTTTLMLTETASKKRASLHVVSGPGALNKFRQNAVDVTTCELPQFVQQLQKRNRTVKLALIDPAAFDGIGNAYSDEILHRARMSPFARTGKLDPESLQRLFGAARSTLLEWRQRLIAGNRGRFPERITAFRPEMAVHGKFGKPCPVCHRPVQRICFSDREWNYCAGCQTGGRRLADRSLSRLLRDEWRADIDEIGPDRERQ
jgi:formamidopyrimidine-DNA glycosylase